MDAILRLAKKYSKKKHTNILPCCDVNILENLHFLYDEDWENQSTYPYEVLTYLFDCYYVLPQRPDLASLFCWQAINHSYYVQQLGISNVVKSNDTRGVELVRKTIITGWSKYEPILTPYLEKMPMKAFHYAAAYLLKGYAIEQRGIAEKYAASSYKTLTKQIPILKDILKDSYGKAYCNIANSVIVNSELNLGIGIADKVQSCKITHSFAQKLQELMLGEEVEITLCDAQGRKQKYKFTVIERMSFVLFGILYASRCNNFHGNVAARMNSIRADKKTFKMYTDIFLLEYIVLAIHMNSQGNLSDTALDKVKENAALML